MTSTTLRRAPAAIAVLALAAGIAACSANGGGATQPAARTQPPAQSQPAAQSQAPSSVAPASEAPASAGAQGDCPTAAPDPLPAGVTRDVTIETELGQIVIDVEADLGPLAAGNFVALAECGFYDGVVFHRTIPGFVIQGGDPTGTGSGGPGYQFPNDPVSVAYERGVVAMANAGRDTNGSQFFIVLDEAGLPPDYSVFGRVTSGMDVADAIAAAADGEIPSNPVEMTNVTVATP
jgi:cyclophilin family peptidyl-prolyl cis-trans isomerase